jgi:hypothetical protein
VTPDAGRRDRLRGKATLPPTYRETPDVADATGRLIKAVGKRVATEDPDGLACLAALGESLAEAWRCAIDGLRASGFSDREIGEQLGTSRQAVEQRWPHERKDVA